MNNKIKSIKPEKIAEKNIKCWYEMANFLHNEILSAMIEYAIGKPAYKIKVLWIFLWIVTIVIAFVIGVIYQWYVIN